MPMLIAGGASPQNGGTATLSVIVVFSKRLQEGNEGGEIVLAQRHVCEFGRSVAHGAGARELRHLNIVIHHVVKRDCAPIVEVRRRVSKVAQNGSLELSNGGSKA